MKALLARRALFASLCFAVPMAVAWAVVLKLFEDRPEVLRWAGVGIYSVALVAAVLVGRRLRVG